MMAQNSVTLEGTAAGCVTQLAGGVSAVQDGNTTTREEFTVHQDGGCVPQNTNKNDVATNADANVALHKVPVVLAHQEDDVALVDVRTDAMASVLSPNVWIRRPRKAATPVRSPDGTGRPVYYTTTKEEVVSEEAVTPSRRIQGRKDKTPARTPRGAGLRKRRLPGGDVVETGEGYDSEEAMTPGKRRCGDEETTAHMLTTENNNNKRRRKKSAVLKNEDYIVDDEATLVETVRQDGGGGASTIAANDDVAVDMQKALEENDRAEADLKEISEMENDIANMRDATRMLEHMLASKTRQLEEMHAQNATIKRIFSAIEVVKDDFITEGLSDEEKRAKMVGIGKRLIHHLRVGDGNTTHSLRGDARAQTGGGRQQAAQKGACKSHSLPMAAPEMHPVESQIAAASLIAAKGDPARALVSLLEKGLEARRKSS
jgi:hypothetical protein